MFYLSEVKNVIKYKFKSYIYKFFKVQSCCNLKTVFNFKSNLNINTIFLLIKYVEIVLLGQLFPKKLYSYLVPIAKSFEKFNYFDQ